MRSIKIILLMILVFSNLFIHAVTLNSMNENKIQLINNLKNPDKRIRLSSYKQIGLLKDKSLIDTVISGIKEENDNDVKEKANESLNRLLLFAGDEKEQSQCLARLKECKNEKTLNLLKTYISNSSVSDINKIKAKNIIISINKKNYWISVLQNIFSGLSLGSILILVALGLSIIYGLAGIINMSHGEFIMIGAYTTYVLQQWSISSLPEYWTDTIFFLSLPAAFIVSSLIGLIIERLIIRHLYNKPLESLLATCGISLILIQLARNIFGDLTSVKVPTILSGGFEVSNNFILPYNRLFIIVLTMFVFLLVYILFKCTRLGIKIRSVSQNRKMSACVGISTKRVDMTTFMLGSGLAGIAGWAITLIGNVVPNMGQSYIVDSFLVVVTGGVGKLLGCVVSGLGIGVLSKFCEAGFEAVYGKVLILIFIIIFLQIKPKGLFSDKGRIGDD